MHLWIQCMLIRVSRDQRSFDSFPGLFAVFHALLRLLAPRHPPHALSSLAALIPPSNAPLDTPKVSPRSRHRFQDHIEYTFLFSLALLQSSQETSPNSTSSSRSWPR